MTKVALITGANKGIGFEIARGLAADGITVLMGARDESRGEYAAKQLRDDGLDCDFVRLDVTDAAIVAEAARTIEAQYSRLDILVNNAGVSRPDPALGLDAPESLSRSKGPGTSRTEHHSASQTEDQNASRTEHQSASRSEDRTDNDSAPNPNDQSTAAASPRGWLPSTANVDAMRAVFEVNVFGIVSVTNAMLPLLRRADAARIVNVTSEVGSFALTLDQSGPYWRMISLAYPVSKTAANMVTVDYAKELWDTPIKVNAVCPGYTATDLNDHTGFKSPADAARIAVRMARIDANGPTGGFFNEAGVLHW